MYYSIDRDSFGSYPYATRTLFDAMLGNYVQNTYPQRDIEYKILFTIFMLCSHVFLLNYLIAILSSVYAIMSARGKFAFLSNKYQYVEKFRTVLNDRCGYQELVIHALPFNVLSFPLLFFIFKKNQMVQAAFYFSFTVFWIENAFFMCWFFLYELMLMPLIYFKTFGRLLDVPRKLNVCKF